MLRIELGRSGDFKFTTTVNRSTSMASESEESEFSDVEEGSGDSDAELQAAFKAGLLKPGLNTRAPKELKEYRNNVAGLKHKLAQIRQSLEWRARLDLTNKPAPAAPNMEVEEEGDTDTHNDFKRELKFYRQAQASALEGLARLHKLGIPTRRPDDYFAQMAKTDDHMKKVREKLLAKQLTMERSEKAKKLRELRKYGKKVQTEVLQNRQKEKKKMLDQVKKYRKGQENKLDFLDDDGQLVKSNKAFSKGENNPSANKKRMYKNAKFGFGGQKKRSKLNTAKSASDMSDFSSSKHSSRPLMFNKGNKNKKSKRPGKQRRQVMKSKKKR